jgi:hypothetical protein
MRSRKLSRLRNYRELLPALRERTIHETIRTNTKIGFFSMTFHVISRIVLYLHLRIDKSWECIFAGTKPQATHSVLTEI